MSFTDRDQEEMWRRRQAWAFVSKKGFHQVCKAFSKQARTKHGKQGQYPSKPKGDGEEGLTNKKSSFDATGWFSKLT
jgi:hypothetical protein